jgi:hypothetical protein
MTTLIANATDRTGREDVDNTPPAYRIARPSTAR